MADHIADPSTPAAITAWVEADRRLELSTMREQLSEDAVLRSPLTDAFDFRGREEVMAVFASAFELLTDIEIHRLTGAERDWALHGTNRLGGRNLEELQWLRLDDTGKISEITLFIRPVAAAVSLFAKIGQPLARRGAMRPIGGVASSMLTPIAAGFRLNERRLMPRLKDASGRQAE